MELLTALLRFDYPRLEKLFIAPFIGALIGAGTSIYLARRQEKRVERATENRRRQAQAALEQAKRKRMSDRLNAEKVAARDQKLSKSRKKRRDQRQSNAAALYQMGGFPGRPQGSGGGALSVGDTVLGGP